MEPIEKESIPIFSRCK